MMPFEEHLLRREGKTPAPANGKRQHWIGGAACAVLALVAIGGGAFSPAPPAAPAQQARVGDRVYFAKDTGACTQSQDALFSGGADNYFALRKHYCQTSVGANSYGTILEVGKWRAENPDYYVDVNDGYASRWVSRDSFTIIPNQGREKL